MKNSDWFSCLSISLWVETRLTDVACTCSLQLRILPSPKQKLSSHQSPHIGCVTCDVGYYKGTCIRMRLLRQMAISGHWPSPMDDTPIDLLRLWVATPKYQFALIRFKNKNFHCTISARHANTNLFHQPCIPLLKAVAQLRNAGGNEKMKRRKVWVTKSVLVVVVFI